MMTAPPNKSGPSCNEKEEERGEERRSALEGGGKRGGGGNKHQWLINLFVYNEQRKIISRLRKTC